MYNSKTNTNQRETPLKDYISLKIYPSSNKKVDLIEFEGKKCILKQCDDSEKIAQEVELMRSVARTGYAPQVIRSQDNYIIYEFMEGSSVADIFHAATMTDDAEQQEILAKKLCVFLQMFHSIADGKILCNVNFNNFIINDDRCVGVDFYEVKEGMPYNDVAGIIAYALCNAVGNYYSGFPFVAKVLECYHITIMDIINELSEQLDGLYKKYRHIDKTIFIDALISYEEKGSVWNFINKK